jgi:protein-tyrosine phosphatase
LIDLHLHLLHATDDGALHLEQAVRMAKLAAADGCAALVATPHQRRDEWETADPKRLRDRLAEIEASVGGAIELRLGAEVRVDSDILADLDHRDRSGVLSLAGSRYMLLELDPVGVGPDPVELARELHDRGLTVILAHAELIPFLWDEAEDWFPRLREAGALTQVTAMSVTGEFGRGPRERAWELLRGGFAQFVASDAHRDDWRPPGLSRARALIAATLGDAVAEAVTSGNPRAVLEDRALRSAAPSPFVARPAWGAR